MNCPVCDVNLVISSREGIEIDYCPQCRGVWLDRGELDKIIERAGPAGGGRDYEPRREDRYRDERPRRDDDDWDDRRSGRRRKKRSFLEDIFEFD